MAHSSTVNCAKIGKKACRLLITGGDDCKVNLWAIGKPTSLMSLCGHTTPIESIAFDAGEVLVLAGASAGALKLWDLEEAKIVRTLTGHRSNCTGVEFHPFGEFFASGSMDTHLRIWDIRKKGCIHTYKGHVRGISTIRFTPDGRWVVSGGYDNVVKIWDLTAGKLLHDFKFHEGHIRSIDFHPLEFLLATGSGDRTVKFWDLETFELIGTSRPEATGVRAITFHPDGRSLFCGSDDGLKVYSWEPVVRHDSVDIGWSTLGDLCINEGKLLGCSYYQNSVGVWVADISRIEPYGAGFVHEQNECTEKKFDLQKSPSEKVGSGKMSTTRLCCMSPDSEGKEIKNIYVDSAGGKPVTSQRVGSLNTPEVVLSEKPEQGSNLHTTEKQSPVKGVYAEPNKETFNNSSVIPSIVPRDNPAVKRPPDSRNESITFSRTKPGMLLRPAHTRRSSNSKIDTEKLPEAVEPRTVDKMKNEIDGTTDRNSPILPVLEDKAWKSTDEKDPNIKGVADKFKKFLSPEKPSSQENCEKSSTCHKETNPVKYVNGVAVVRGRTRSLVEKFERREMSSTNDDQTTSTIPHITAESVKTPTNHITPELDKRPTSVLLESDQTPVQHITPQVDQRPNSIALLESDTIPVHDITPQLDKTPPSVVLLESDKTPVYNITPYLDKRPTSIAINEPDKTPVYNITPCLDKRPTSIALKEPDKTPVSHVVPQSDKRPPMSVAMPGSNRRRSMSVAMPQSRRRSPPISIFVPESDRRRSISVAMPQSDTRPPVTVVIPESDKIIATMKEDPQISGRDSASVGGRDIIEILMETHDVFTSILKSRLTKLQVVRHFWERKDLKGAIDALRRLPDHSVQADAISGLMEKMEVITLDLFSSLLPVLVGLLDSKMERHISMSLEMLLKLVAVFGPVIQSTISAPPVVGVDLHAEQRRECCNQCFLQLQKIQKMLQVLKRRGGVVAKCAHELNLVLEES